MTNQSKSKLKAFYNAINFNNAIKAGWMGLFLGILIISLGSMLVEGEHWIGLLAIAFGIFISGTGYYCLVTVLPLKAKNPDVSISMTALRASLWLVIAGIIIFFLGFLNLMQVLPPPGW